MVSITSIIFMFISLALSLVIPVVVMLLLHKRLKFTWRAVIVGVFIFLIFQILTRIPLITYLSSTTNWFTNYFTKHYILYILLLAFTAGLFEESGRYIGFKFFLKDHLTWENGIGYGIGHGGLESVFIGSAFLNNFILSILINIGRAPLQIPESIISRLVQTSPYLFLIGGIERVFAFVVQIGLSIIVLYAVKRRKLLFLILAIFLHAAIDLIPVQYSQNILLSESFIGIFAALFLVWIFQSRKLFNGEHEI